MLPRRFDLQNPPGSGRCQLPWEIFRPCQEIRDLRLVSDFAVKSEHVKPPPVCLRCDQKLSDQS